jgi:K+-transporting ATPase A subunit
VSKKHLSWVVGIAFFLFAAIGLFVMGVSIGMNSSEARTPQSYDPVIRAISTIFPILMPIAMIFAILLLKKLKE